MDLFYFMYCFRPSAKNYPASDTAPLHPVRPVRPQLRPLCPLRPVHPELRPMCPVHPELDLLCPVRPELPGNAHSNSMHVEPN